MAVPVSPGPVIGSLCTGYGGLDLRDAAALGGGRIAWCADPDPHTATILTTRMPDVPNLGDLRAVDWTQVEPVEELTAGFPCQQPTESLITFATAKGYSQLSPPGVRHMNFQRL
jgi:DNA (cytosine-5)-methyltransferase 1